VLGSVTRTPLLILLVAVSLVLLIACANVANLVMARSCHRQPELAVRAAIGASSERLLRQLLTESLILALAGSAAGILLAHGSLAILRSVAAAAMPITFRPELDVRVLLVTLALTLAIGPLCGLLPALRARRPNLNAVLTNGSRGATAAGHQRTQAMLIVAELALMVVLLSAGLLFRSLANAASIDPGFEQALRSRSTCRWRNPRTHQTTNGSPSRRPCSHDCARCRASPARARRWRFHSPAAGMANTSAGPMCAPPT
jgi:putative ABC transport system permease protein